VLDAQSKPPQGYEQGSWGPQAALDLALRGLPAGVHAPGADQCRHQPGQLPWL